VNNKMLNVLIVEDDTRECELYKGIIDARDDVKLVSITNSSTKALEEVRKNKVDAVILDLELNDGEGSGFEFIDKIKELKLSNLPNIVVTTNVHSDSVYDFCHRNNIDFVFYKGQSGYSRENVINTLMLLNSYEKGNNIININKEVNLEEVIISKINKELDLIGIGTHLSGRKYIVDAILYIIQTEGDNKLSIIQHLVSRHKRSSSTISRAIQNAILHAWRITPIEDLSKYYTARVNYETGIPTPTELLYHYADKIKKEL